MDKKYSSQGYIDSLGKLVRDYRIEFPLTQQELAEKCGLSLRTIQNLESGKDIRLDSFIKVLMVLGLDRNLSMLIPDVGDRPSVHLKEKEGKRKQRVRHPKVETTGDFKWGDEL